MIISRELLEGPRVQIILVCVYIIFKFIKKTKRNKIYNISNLTIIGKLNNRQIVLKKVKTHNLKNVDLTLDPFQIIVFTGVSGSGKSSLAFDTIFIEGQRRYIESLPASIRRYIPELSKPDAQLIEGLSPTIAIEQKTVLKTPRSTVGTITGIYDFLRVLYSKVATLHCPISDEIVTPQSREKIIEEIIKNYSNKKIIVLSPSITAQKGSLKEDIEHLIKKGFTRVRIDKKIFSLEENISLDPLREHNLEIIIDRITLDLKNISRVKEDINLALKLSNGTLIIVDIETEEEKFFSEYAFSPKSNQYYKSLSAVDFSFNNPNGMCLKCQGLGEIFEFDINRIIDEELSISENCCKIQGSYQTVKYKNIYDNLAKIYKFSVKDKFKNLSKKAKDIFLYGTDEWIKMRFIHPRKNTRWDEFVKYKGVLFEAHKKLDKATSETYRSNMQEYMSKKVCDECKGAKIRPYPANARINGKKIHELTAFSILKIVDFFKNLKLKNEDFLIAKDVISEILKKLSFLINVGLHYLALDRISPTLSGGESQRVRLASQIGSSLSGAIYILDEPSIGLHPMDHNKLIDTFKLLKEENNTIIIVEHDKDTIESADTIVDVGPLAGKMGGEILVKGSIEDIIKNERSLTGKYLSNELQISVSKEKRGLKKFLTITNCTHNNLKNVDLKIPLNNFISITGVSGSGKSSLIADTLYPAISNILNKSKHEVGKYDKIIGLENINHVIFVDQSPIGRTIRSNTATYTKLFDDIRELFSQTKASKIKGFLATHFSFNTKEGTCQYCNGLGKVKVDMDFMEDIFSTCLQCGGKRFSKDILDICYKDKNIFDVLNMDVDEAYEFFKSIPKIESKLLLLKEVGLGYLPIGQSATTLSGGEAQRIKLSKELSNKKRSNTLYILDEPTTGLHFHDIQNLLTILHRLVDNNNTVIVIEHNMDFVKTSDWIIDIGPEASENGGKIIAEGDISSILKKDTPTSKALKKALKEEPLKSKKTKEKKIVSQNILINKASENNLKNVDLEILHNKINIFTGPSGSGKSSVAFDTIFNEGQIRYLQSLGNFAKQFLNKIKRPEVESIKNLYPTIAIEQKGHLLSPRSTIGTITEIYDYLRLLYTHMGTAHSPETKEILKTISIDYVLDKLLSTYEDKKIQILSPVYLGSSETFEDFTQKYISKGFLKIRINKDYYSFEEKIDFNNNLKNSLYLVIDRLIISKSIKNRLYEALKLAATISNNEITIALENEDLYFNLSFADEKTGKSYPPITFQTFSFNHEEGMCLDCLGLGFIYGANLEDAFTSKNNSILDILNNFFNDEELDLMYEYFNFLKIDAEKPIKKLSLEELQIFLNGSEKEFKYKNIIFVYKGFNKTLEDLSKHSSKEIKEYLIPILEKRSCQSCNGERLNPLARNVLIKDLSITAFTALPAEKALNFINTLTLDKKNRNILEDVLNFIKKSLTFLNEIGLGYISLDRSAPTLSGGEMQRVRLSKQLGSYLTSCIYILDEPTIGLHPHNISLLFNALKKLNDLGNTLIVVEHDPMFIKKADYIFDFGKGAGYLGGEIIAKGSVDEILKNKNSITGKYLSNKNQIEMNKNRRDISNKKLKIRNAKVHNLKNISFEVPLNAITVLSGVSGSGKSTILYDIIKPASISAIKQKIDFIDLYYAQVEGLKNFSRVVVLDQSPIGQTSRADVGTYSELMPILRKFYAELLLSKTKGLRPQNFSYNHLSGMCRTCWGLGYKHIQLQFLPPIKVECESCHGKKLNQISLEVKYNNKNLGEVLDLTLDEAKQFFEIIPKIVKKINIIQEVGLGYLKIGQDLNTLSLGEAQRLRLCLELEKQHMKNTLFLFDEPTTGLHFVDIEKLMKIFNSLADKKTLSLSLNTI